VGAGGEVEGTIGLGGGNKEVEVFGGGQASGNVGPAEGEIKAGITVSSKEGVSVGAEASGTVGPTGGSVKLDKTGVHANLESQKKSDTKVGGHVQIGIGAGVKLNLSQASRAIANTQKAAGALMTAIGGTLRNFGVPFNSSPHPSFVPQLN